MAPLSAMLLALAVGVIANPPAPEHPLVAALKARVAEDFLLRPGERLTGINGERAAALNAGVTPAQFDGLTQLVEEARAIQRGRRAEESQDAFNRMIQDVARRLGATPVGRAVQIYGTRERRADGPGASQEDIRREMAARARTYASVYASLGPEGRRRMDGRIADLTSRFGVMNAAADGGAGAGLRPASFVARAAAAPVRFVAANGRPAPSPTFVAMDAADYRRLNGQPGATRYPSRPGVVPPVASAPESGMRWAYSTVLSFVDPGRVTRLAQELARNARTTFGRCYEFVKDGMIAAGFFPSNVRVSTDVSRIGIGSGSAYMFARLTDAQLRERRLRVVRPSTIPWAPANDNLEGYTLVWAPGCNGEEIGRNGRGAHPEHGHIETIVSRRRIPSMSNAVQERLLGPLRNGVRQGGVLQNDDMLAVSDHATGRNVNVLRRYSADPQVHSRIQRSMACLTVLAPVNAP